VQVKRLLHSCFYGNLWDLLQLRAGHPIAARAGSGTLTP
jgi:hypothetical protein